MSRSFYLGVVSVLVIGVLAIFFLTSQQAPKIQERLTSPSSTPESTNSAQSSKILAGQSSLLYNFDQTQYQTALKSDKVIFLYFYANWCPICREEFPKMQSAFNQLATDRVIGFRVNYNDNETDAAENSLASEFGVAYQHTKVAIKNGQRVLKSPESWDQARYLTEINKLLP